MALDSSIVEEIISKVNNRVDYYHVLRRFMGKPEYPEIVKACEEVLADKVNGMIPKEVIKWE